MLTKSKSIRSIAIAAIFAIISHSKAAIYEYNNTEETIRVDRSRITWWYITESQHTYYDGGSGHSEYWSESGDIDSGVEFFYFSIFIEPGGYAEIDDEYWKQFSQEYREGGEGAYYIQLDLGHMDVIFSTITVY